MHPLNTAKPQCKMQYEMDFADATLVSIAEEFSVSHIIKTALCCLAPINELYVFRSLRLVPDSWPPIPVFLLLLPGIFLKYLFTYA
jgi:hypothetical protein